MVSRLYANGPTLRRRWPKRRARSARVGQVTVPVGQQLSSAQKILCRFRSARVGVAAADPSAVVKGVRVAISSSDLRKYLDDLNLQHALLSTAIETQHFGGTLDKSKAKQFVKVWREYLNHKLPTSILFYGVAPVYSDGPLGWRQWYDDNTGSFMAMKTKPSRIREWGKEYQSKLREFHQRFEAIGGVTSREAPEQPSIEEMPGPIAPVPTQEDVEEAAEAVGEAVTTVVLAPVKGAREAAEKAIGFPPEFVGIGLAVAAAIAAVVALRVVK